MKNTKSGIDVFGARVHNLKNIDVSFPHNSLSVVTGLSGCGKSSLAFDTVFAEGQRRYIETFSAYARNMLGSLERPDVDKITGLSPVISIEQKTVNRNPRSTVGTTTEIYDFLRLLFARVSVPFSYITGKPMVKYTSDQIVDLIVRDYKDRRIYVLAPLVKNRKGHYKELFESLRKKGYLRVYVDGELLELNYGMKLDRYKNHTIDLVVDRIKAGDEDVPRLRNTIQEALRQGEKQIKILDADSGELRHFSQLMMDPEHGLSYPEPAPHNFSFNSPQGACPRCKGLGTVNSIDIEKLIPDRNKTIAEGGITALGKHKNNLIFWQIEAICRLHDTDIHTPLKDVPAEAIDDIMNGTNERLHLHTDTGVANHLNLDYNGLIKYIEMQNQEDAGYDANKWSGQFYTRCMCPECGGKRLNKVALHHLIDGKNIADISEMEIEDLYAWTTSLSSKLKGKDKRVAGEILKEINSRLKFLLDVGLNYVTLNRTSGTLSGGESQRIRLATQMGSQLVNVLYILDEPSIGLHQKDNRKLISSLKTLRDAGNSIIVVEHDRDIMEDADYIVDIGPGAGAKGGEVVFQGTPSQLRRKRTLTSDYLTGRKSTGIPARRREGSGKFLELIGASGNNLRDVHLKLPLGKFVCVSGVSGSGKSSLINATLQPILSRRFYGSAQEPLPYREIRGIENVDKVVTVDQSPLGRTPRSNPATYTGVFADIRKLFVELPEAKVRGYKPGRFSFNVSGGRCEVCKGNGCRTIEMNFLPDVLVPCEQCHGKRYNRETLEVRYKGKSISDVLEMTVNEAVDFFANIPAIYRKIKVLQDIGLGYIRLGQPSSTLSGGENQRVKLATELAKKDTGNTVFLLDEPTTGLHFEDIRILLDVINRLVDKGNTVVVIEHNLDIIKNADYIIDMGPGGGKDGGSIVAVGTPEEVALSGSPTAPFILEELKGASARETKSAPAQKSKSAAEKKPAQKSKSGAKNKIEG